MQTRIMLAALTGLSALAAFAPAAEAANRFALACIENKTDIALNYQFRWGEGGAWASRTLSPGARRAHWWKYDNPNEARSPWLHVRFDSDLSKKMIQQGYRLSSHASPQESDCKAYGKEYVFRYDGNARNYIDLKAVRE